jgi:aminopeptidase N
MLRDLIGTEPFWRGIRLYYQRYANGLASTADLRRTMEEVSGQDLRWFFAQWLTRSGVPQVSGDWRYDAVAKQIVVTVRQTQAGDPFRFRARRGRVGSLRVVACDSPGAGGRASVHLQDCRGRRTRIRGARS